MGKYAVNIVCNKNSNIVLLPIVCAVVTITDDALCADYYKTGIDV